MLLSPSGANALLFYEFQYIIDSILIIIVQYFDEKRRRSIVESKRLFVRNCAQIVKKTHAHMGAVLKEYGLSGGSYPYLLELQGNEGIHGEDLSKLLGVDKAMSARTIKKLVQAGYIEKIPDEADSRANKLFLTEKARFCIPIITSGTEEWIDYLTQNLEEAEKELLFRLLAKIESKTNSEGQCAN